MKRVPSSAWVLLGGIGFLLLAGCAPELPEPESEGARLYVRYCSGSGCHDPIPPQTDSIGYWNNQYERMLGTMQRAGRALPNSTEDAAIRAYIEKYALH